MKNDVLSGFCEASTYDGKDMTLGMNAECKRVDITGQWDSHHWRAKPGTEYATGKDWPRVRGPNSTGAASDCERPLVDNMHDARLLWVAEEPLSAGKGSRPKVDFGFYPANFSGWGYGGYGAPVVADGRVYLYLLYPDRQHARSNDPAVRQHVLVRRGADPEIVARRRHAIFCFDARSGKTVWRWMSSSFAYAGPSGKSGIGLTPCYLDGKLFARFDRGIACFDAASGDIVWRQDRKAYRLSGGWSHETAL
jgi:outer membrane protein assembly factor BamB